MLGFRNLDVVNSEIEDFG